MTYWKLLVTVHSIASPYFVLSLGALPNPSVVWMHCQLPCIAKQLLYSYLRTLKYCTFVYAPILHKYKTYVRDPQSFMPAGPWHSCRNAALFPNYFGQTCYYNRQWLMSVSKNKRTGCCCWLLWWMTSCSRGRRKFQEYILELAFCQQKPVSARHAV